MLAGLLSLVAAPAMAAEKHPIKLKLPVRVDAVIDISHMTTVHDFAMARKHSNILGVIHKASEGGDWRDPAYAKRRPQAEGAGMLWGAYHYGTHQHSGVDQAMMFLASARPGPDTLMALDLEFNEQNPGNTMRLHQAEEFVKTVLEATGRRPLIYTNANWADGEAMGGRHSLGGSITIHSILASCQLWLADYRSEPQLPSAWSGKGWHFWQYAGDTEDGGPRGARVRSVSGVVRCDRNLFQGDATKLRHFWQKEAGRPVGA
jgi:lysozyme